MRRGWLCALFFVSGASALVYELVWQRMLILIFGVSTLSVSAVLAAFMAGLALGGMVFGRLADRARRPLKLYAWLEAGIAVSGLLVPLAFRATQTIYPSLYNALQAGPWSGTLLRFGLSMLVLIVPATLIGGTLPVMGRLVMRRQETMSAAFSLLYAVNTLGAVAGAALTGFLALRYLGMQHTLWLAAALNMAVALSARFMSRNETEALGGAVRSGRSATESAPQSFMLVLAAVTGVTSMGFEVAWTRILGILTSNSAYGFALLLSVMLLGIGLGSLLQVWWSRRPGDNWSRLALCQWTLVAVTLVTLPFFRAAPAWFDRLCDGTSTVSIFAGELALTAWALLAPAMLMGLSLPLLVAGTVREPGSYGNKLGRLYAVNTLGCVLGAFLTGFVLIPRLGIHATVGVILGATLSVGVIAWERAAALTYRLRVLGNAVVLCAGVVAWLSLPAGPFLKSSLFAPRKLLFYAEGNNATVSVLQEGDGTKSISVDGQPVAGTVGTSVIDQKMLAHLPLLLHHAPHRALTVGFGSGGTSYSMSLHGVAVDCVELEACVPAAAHLFESENHGVFAYPNFRLIVDDARSYLHLAPADYDVIVTDCTNIQYRSNGDLYTVDYFRLMRDRLTPQGIAAAWVPANGIAESDLKILLRSFRQVFPHTTIWYMNTLATDFVIVTGTPTRLEVDLDALGTRMASSDVARDLSEVGLSDPFRLLYTLLVGEDEIEAYLAGGAVNTDDKPVLSYSTYGASFQSTIAGNLSKLLAYRKEVSRYASPSGAGSSHLRHFAASNELILGHIAHLAGADSAALPHYQRAAQLLPDDLAVQALAQPIYRRGYSTASERAD